MKAGKPKKKGRRCIRTLTVDDHALVRDGMTTILQADPEIEMLASACSGQEALDLLATKALENVDVIITDITMEPINGIELLKELQRMKHPARCMVLTMHTGQKILREALEADAWGIVLKDSGFREIKEAIKSIGNGRRYYCEPVTKLIIETFMRQGGDGGASTLPEPSVQFTNREKQVLKLVADQLDNHEIAKALYISARTVETHKYNMLQKTQSKNLAGLLIYALRNGLVGVNDS